jgi:peroxin-10
LRRGEDTVGYEILGIMIIVQQLLGFLAGSAEASKSPDYDDTNAITIPSSSGSTPTASKCMLCLGQRKDSTAVVCGHVFCWKYVELLIVDV